MRIALVSRDELYPVAGGGIGQFVTSAARLLSRVAEVTVFTAAALQPRYEQLREEHDPRLPGAEVQVVFVPEPAEADGGGWPQSIHGYSAQVLTALRETYGDRGPEVIEFADFRGEAFATVEAAWALDPFLERSRVCVRTHTTAEMVEVLNGFCPPDLERRVIHELERHSLARADRVIWEGGDVLGTYRRFYGAEALAAPQRIRYPFAGPITQAEPGFELNGRPLQLIYAGRLERRKGVPGLVSAATASGREDFRLTIVGGDTRTGPLETSVRGQIELAIADDPRIRLLDAVDREPLAQLIAAHDVVAVPSLWECWPYAALEALHLNRPLLGTPVGGLTEMIAAGESGWQASETDPVSLGDALGSLLDAPGEVARMIRAGAPLARGRRLCDEREILDAYQALARAPVSRPVGGWTCESRPAVDAVVWGGDEPELADDTVASLAAQTHPRIQIIVVADPGASPAAVRNLGLARGRGRYVLFIRAGDVAAPELVSRCVEMLERCPELAYATAWSLPLGAGSAGRARRPLSNRAALVEEENLAGDSTAVFRRRLFEAGRRFDEHLAEGEDWLLYRQLRSQGRFGAVIPEPLLAHRSHGPALDSPGDQERWTRLRGEIQARLDEQATQWVPPAPSVPISENPDRWM